jgi:nucleoid DNA-binding protein
MLLRLRQRCLSFTNGEGNTMAIRKKATKKKAVRKTVKKAAVKKKVVKKAPVKLTAIKKAYTKSEVMTHIAEQTELSKKDIAGVFEALNNLMHRHLCKRAAGEFTVPGLMKCRVQRKPATKARKGINPFTKEETMFKAKPARNVVKVRPLKKLKDMAAL